MEGRKMTKYDALRYSNEESNRITRESLQLALIYLMGKKDIEDISITELVEKSGVSRSAFYRNYSSKKDVLLDFSSNVFDLIVASLTVEEYQNNPVEWFKFLFVQLKNNEKVMRLLMKARIFDFGIKSIRRQLEIYEKDKYCLVAFEKGLNAVICRWFNQGLKDTPEEMAKLCMEIFPQIELIFNMKITDIK